MIYALLLPYCEIFHVDFKITKLTVSILCFGFEIIKNCQKVNTKIDAFVSTPVVKSFSKTILIFMINQPINLYRSSSDHIDEIMRDEVRQVRKQTRAVPSWPIEHALPASPTASVHVVRTTETISDFEDVDDVVISGKLLKDLWCVNINFIIILTIILNSLLLLFDIIFVFIQSILTTRHHHQHSNEQNS